jgi:hypothetical protein
MASFNDTLRFCFPQPQPAPTINGTRDRATDTPSGRQEPEDLGKGTKKVTLGNIVRAYALDWILVVAMWYVAPGNDDKG